MDPTEKTGGAKLYQRASGFYQRTSGLLTDGIVEGLFGTTAEPTTIARNAEALRAMEWSGPVSLAAAPPGEVPQHAAAGAALPDEPRRVAPDARLQVGLPGVVLVLGPRRAPPGVALLDAPPCARPGGVRSAAMRRAPPGAPLPAGCQVKKETSF